MKQASLQALLLHWLECYLEGTILSAADLCPEQPQLAEQLQPILDQLRQIERLVAGPASEKATLVPGVLRTDSAVVPPSPSEAPTLLKPAQAPAVDPTGGVDPDATISPADPPTSASLWVRGYELLDELGRGGMGVVYKARQIGLGRIVALKMILAGGHAGPVEHARFKTEAEAIARLHHPGIVQVYEVGEHFGKPYFSLEFCEGGGLDRMLAGSPLPPRTAAELAEVMARAMHVAHQAHVVHRDLKPANVLLTVDGKPKITDFGLAKKLDEAGHTSTGVVMGTPSYMAPEQAEGRKEIGPATDVYALGAILYEMLTGRPPFKAATAIDTIMQVISDEPVPPTRLNAKAPADLETICLMCLQKDSRRRYPTAEALADDLARWLRGEPVHARPVGKMERAWRWGRRNPVVAGLAATVLIVLLAGIGFSTWFAIRANEQAEDARRAALREQKERENADVIRHGFQMTAASQACQQNEVVAAESYLEAVAPAFQQTWEYRHLCDLCRRKAMAIKGHNDSVLAAAFSPDGKRIASASADRTVKVWDSVTGQVHLTLARHTKRVTCVAFSPDGKRIVSGSEDGMIRMWDADTGEELRVFTGNNGIIKSVAVNPDGKRIVSGSEDRTVKVWDADTGEVLRILNGHTREVNCVAIDSAGKRIVSGSADWTVKVWDADTGKLLHSLEGHTDTAHSVAISSDGKRIVSGSADNTLIIWDSNTEKKARTLKGHTESILSVAISPDGQQIVSGGLDKTVKVWDAGTGQELLTLKGHTLVVSSVAISRDGNRILSASHDRSLKVWNPHAAPERFTFKGHTDKVHSVAISPDSSFVVSGGADRKVKVWDALTGDVRLTLTGHTDRVIEVAISGDGKRIISASADKTMKLWHARTGECLHTLQGHSDIVNSVAISADGSLVVGGSADKTVKVWNGHTGTLLCTLTGHAGAVGGVAISLDGRRIVSASADKTAKVWDTETGEELLVLEGHTGSVDSVAISSDGKWIVTGSADNTARVWDTLTGQELHQLKGHTEAISSATISADGTRILTGSLDNTVKIWDSRTGQDLLTLKGHTNDIADVAMSPDGNLVVSASDDHTVRVWYAPPAQRNREKNSPEKTT
jgi:WD40 repeat protein